MCASQKCIETVISKIVLANSIQFFSLFESGKPYNDKKGITIRWHVTISCQPDGRPPQPVRPWKSGRVHLAEGSNVVNLELSYYTEFGRDSRKWGPKI